MNDRKSKDQLRYEILSQREANLRAIQLLRAANSFGIDFVAHIGSMLTEQAAWIRADPASNRAEYFVGALVGLSLGIEYEANGTELHGPSSNLDRYLASLEEKFGSSKVEGA